MTTDPSGLIETEPVGSLPAMEVGHVTFGCLNNFCKVSPVTLDHAWLLENLEPALPRRQLVAG